MLLLVWTVLPGLSLMAEQPQPVSLCAVIQNPVAYQHKLLAITAQVKHGFEEFTFSDPACPQHQLWLEYGGSLTSGTVYCCGSAAKKPLALDGLETPLIDDKAFRNFDGRIRKAKSAAFEATSSAVFSPAASKAAMAILDSSACSSSSRFDNARGW